VTPRSPVEELVVEVADDRTVAARVQGAGPTVLFLHGTPGSRVLAPHDDTVLTSAGVQLLTLDRPGYGGSTPRPGRSVLQCAEDVVAVADAVGARHFGLAAYSGGAQYALAVAARHADRVTSVALVSPLGPLDTSGDERALPEARALQVRFLRAVPATTRVRTTVAALALRRTARRRLHEPRDAIDELGASSAADARVLEDDRVRQMLERDVVESLRQGAAGWAADAATMVERWPVDPHAIRAPITIWHGTDDADVRVVMARALARWLPAVTLVEVPDAGHLVLHTIWPDVLTARPD
jgi:pimeloyl-ACP methyl ester carboxylesterase